MKDSLRKILTEAGVMAEGVLDPAQAEIVGFACAMHNRMIEKQKHIAGRYNGQDAVEGWVKDYDREQLYELLLNIGKNVTELAKEVKDGTVSGTSSTDIANLALIVDCHLRNNYGS